MSKEWNLTRFARSARWTLGVLKIPDCPLLFTLELPWKNNEKNVSCIPPGSYDVELTYSSKFVEVLPLLTNVPQRDSIRIHSGNFITDTEGCILVGTQLRLESEPRLGLSRHALKHITSSIDSRGATLKIGYGELTDY